MIYLAMQLSSTYTHESVVYMILTVHTAHVCAGAGGAGRRVGGRSSTVHTCGPRLLLSRGSGAPILIAPVLRRSFIYCPHRWLWKALSRVYISFSFISCIWSDVWHTSALGHRRTARRLRARNIRSESFSQEKYNGHRQWYCLSAFREKMCYLLLSLCGNTQGVNKKSIII